MFDSAFATITSSTSGGATVGTALGRGGSSKSNSPLRLHIDLYNFDDPRFEDYRYVLTSPRSIEACQRLGVKPVSLLPKSFARFQDEKQQDPTRAISGSVDVRSLYEEFLEYEKHRLELVDSCRAERKRIADEEIVRRVVSDGSQEKAWVPAPSTVSFAPSVASIKRPIMLPPDVLEVRPIGKVSLPNSADEARQLSQDRVRNNTHLEELRAKLDKLELEVRMLRRQDESANATAFGGGIAGLSGGVSTVGVPPPTVNWQSAAVDDVDFDGGGAAANSEQRWLVAELKNRLGYSPDVNALIDEDLRATEHRKMLAERAMSTHSAAATALKMRHLIGEEMQQQRQATSEIMDAEWQRLMLERREAETMEARARRRQLLIDRKLKAQRERLDRQRAQLGAKRRIDNEEELHRQMLKLQITGKDKRTSDVLRQKELEMEKSRTIARLSEKIREDMRRSLNADSFDKKAIKAVLESQIGRGPRTYVTNKSKLRLG